MGRIEWHVSFFHIFIIIHFLLFCFFTFCRYFALVNDLQWKVRRSLSHSLHEVAKLLGIYNHSNNCFSLLFLLMQHLQDPKLQIHHFYKHLICFWRILMRFVWVWYATLLLSFLLLRLLPESRIHQQNKQTKKKKRRKENEKEVRKEG